MGWFKRTAWKHVYYLGWNRSPAQVGCMRQVLGPGTLGRPRGSGWRERWEGGSGWGTHVNPWLFHFNVWQNPLQIKKIIIKKKRKGIEKKNDGYSDLSEVVPHCSFKPISYFCYCIYFPYLGLHIHKITSNFSLFSMILKIIHVVVWIGRLLVFITG